MSPLRIVPTRPQPPPIPPWAYVCLAASILCITVAGIGAYEIDRVHQDGTNRMAAAEQTKLDLDRWQQIAPAIANDAKNVRNDLQRSCGVLRDTNGSLLALVRTLDQPKKGIRAKSEDGLVIADPPNMPLAANLAPVPTPSPAPLKTAGSANAATTSTPAATPPPPALPNSVALTPDGIQIAHKTLTLTGPYGAVLHDLDQLAALPLPITITSYTIKRREGVSNSVEFKAQVMLALPPRDVCTGVHA
jgi:hypothetical protein